MANKRAGGSVKGSVKIGRDSKSKRLELSFKTIKSYQVYQ